ncbi:hypothetical protein BGY98DRAFT_145696 [Russula aff. rugulosa BPL654]|nr:hypothetical protein BGY98DRAFT_353573 [Russula aff. rugulosa BPL654]KAI0272996.1 hypothetical protein BGY98DRAFT_145696 [Russula aff. rugulosa BPL654]
MLVPFGVRTSNREKSKNLARTQRILLDILCDLVFRSRGVFSGLYLSAYIVEMLLNFVGKMVKGHGDLNPHINEVIDELKDDNLRNCMDNRLRDQALMPSYPHNHSGLESLAHTNPTSLSSVHGGTLSICPVFYGFSCVDFLESVGGATLSGPEGVYPVRAVLYSGIVEQYVAWRALRHDTMSRKRKGGLCVAW